MNLTHRPRAPRLTGGAAIGIVGLLAALAVMFSNASGTQKTADEAVAAQHVETALGSLTTLRSTLGQTLLVVEASPESGAIPFLIEDARLLSGQLEARMTAATNALVATDGNVALDATNALSEAEAMLEAAATGDSFAALEQATSVAMEFNALATQLTTARDTLIVGVTASGLQAGRVATAARFMVALGIPGLGLFSWASIARRRRRKARMVSALEGEREINRSKDQMIANISHELRTPLTGIYASALSIAERGQGDPDLAAELNSVIIEQSIELTRMVEDLLVSAQADADRLSLAIQEVDISEAVASVVTEFARTETTVESSCEPGTAVADPLRLRQILRNLIANARNHGGAHLGVRGETVEDHYRLTVFDDGEGVPPEIEGRLFTPFVHQGDRPLITGSVGLGLSITRLLAEAMGGTITYEREDGETRFLIDLPMPPADPAPTSGNEIVDDVLGEAVSST